MWTKLQVSRKLVPFFRAEPEAVDGAFARLRGEPPARWARVRGLAQLWWNELNEEDLYGVAGPVDLARVIQRRLGCGSAEAELEVSRFLLRVERTLRGQ